MAQSYGPSPIVTDGLVFCMDAGNTRSYTSGSSTCTDMVFNAQGTIDNTITFNSANGGFWQFDGSDSDIAFGAQTAGQWSTNPCTYEFVFQTYGGGHTLWMDRAVYDGSTGVQIYVVESGPNVAFYTRGSSGTSINTSAIYYINTWYHMVWRFDGTTGTLFINGSQALSGTIATVANSTSNSYIGSYGDGNEGFNGEIALMRIYHKAFTLAEVTQNYNSQKARFGL